MLVNDSPQTTLWYQAEQCCVFIIDQTLLPHRFEIIALRTLDDFCHAISTMQVRGAPLIGVTAAYGLATAIADDHDIEDAAAKLIATRPTAINLSWAINRIRIAINHLPKELRAARAFQEADKIRQEDISHCEAIGNNGLALIKHIQKQKPSSVVNVLTHCNAGWLATIDWGTALAPIYKAQQAGIDIHVWVDETRPRNQGASLTAWELQQQGINHTVIADNTGGHLMQHGMVDCCLVGSDRTAANGDVCNKIGTYLKALAASDNTIPFYVAVPSSSIDWNISNGLTQIPIEQRSSEEVTSINGLDRQGNMSTVQLVANSKAANYAFDVTPARLVSALITEHGIYQANANSLATLRSTLSKQATDEQVKDLTDGQFSATPAIN